MTCNQISNMFTYEFPEVDSDLSIFTVPEEDSLGMEHMLEPHCNKGFSEDLDFNTLHSQKCFDIENFSFAVELDQIKIDGETLHSNVTHGGENKEEALKKKRQEDNDDVVQGLNSLIVMENTALAVEVSDRNSCKNPSLEKPSLGRHFQGLCKSESDVLSSTSTLVPEATCDQILHLLDLMTVRELQEAFRTMFGPHETLVMDKQWLKRRVSVGLQSNVELKSIFRITYCDVNFDQDEGNTTFSSRSGPSGSSPVSIGSPLCNERRSRGRPKKRKKPSDLHYQKTTSCVGKDGEDKAGLPVREKRMRKPPKRYIEEPLDLKSRSYYVKCGTPQKNTKSRSSCIKHHKKVGLALPNCEDESFKGGCIQVPFGLPIEEGHLVKKNSTLDFEDGKDNRLIVLKRKCDIESYSAESEDENSEGKSITNGNARKTSSRRKHHISWTLSEVMKLIEGVSRYGVGRWTEIKRLQFPSSTHRTSVDLKDKWRNLLRASDAQLQSGRKVELGKKQASHQVPVSVLRQVRELATIYPYPRESKSKPCATTPSASPFQSTPCNVWVPLSTVV